MSDYIQVEMIVNSETDKDVMIARLINIGFEGFEEEKNVVRAFIAEKDYNERYLQSIAGENGRKYVSSLIKHQNWNEAWEASFEPVILEDFCAVRAEFHAPIHRVLHEIIITPKMSFGTGHHATTFMMINAMRHIDIKAKSVFDFGTGTGILAVLAEKMGASSIEAIDNDDWSIENGKENLRINNCRKVTLYKSDSLPLKRKVDLLLANLNKNVIVHHLKWMKKILTPLGIVLISGLLVDDLDELIIETKELKFALLAKQEINGWLCLKIANSVD